MRRAAPKAGTTVEDCALEGFVDHSGLRKLAQLRPTAAGLARSAAHPANEVGPSKKSPHFAASQSMPKACTSVAFQIKNLEEPVGEDVTYSDIFRTF